MKNSLFSSQFVSYGVKRVCGYINVLFTDTFIQSDFEEVMYSMSLL